VSMETTLDVCMVHAIAPATDIALVVASTPAGNVINLAFNYAITHHLGCVISQSFGIPEYVLKANNAQILQAHYNYWLASQPEYKITVFASAGDDGATNGGPYNNALYPSPSDIVTTGGAMSTWFPLPDWQIGITLTFANGTEITPTGRCTSDVAFDSGVYGGLGA